MMTHTDMMSTGSDYARPELLAEPDWLWAQGSRSDLRVVDCGVLTPTWQPDNAGTADAYRQGHIPHAVPLPVHNWLKDPAKPLHVIRPKAFAGLMGSLGVDHSTTVVAYDRAGGLYAARLWWVLTYYGHTKVKVLDGGWDRWAAEGRPVTAEATAPPPGRFSPRLNDRLLCRGDELKTRLAQPDLRILDARSYDEHAGITGQSNRRAGHIPDAVHLEWKNFVTEDDRPVFKPASKIRDVLGDAALSPKHDIVTHCQAGIRASLAALVLMLLGWPRVRLYDASMAEWANRDDTPLTTTV